MSEALKRVTARAAVALAAVAVMGVPATTAPANTTAKASAAQKAKAKKARWHSKRTMNSLAGAWQTNITFVKNAPPQIPSGKETSLQGFGRDGLLSEANTAGLATGFGVWKPNGKPGGFTYTFRELIPLPGTCCGNRDLRDFTDFVFGNVEDAWTAIFREKGSAYRPATLVLYRNGVTTGGCGSASSAVGPFYCTADQRVYIDLSFYRAMRDELGAPGDFAWAYVIAHELGHHVQNITGTSDEVTRLQRDNRSQANALSVRLELQADCYAGVWGQTTFKAGILEDGDLEEGLNAAAAVGDDRLQGSTGSIDPDSFTHGTSEQRQRWFRTGFDSGDPERCNTFDAQSL